MFFFPRWPVVHVHQNWYYRSKVVNNIKSSIGHLNHQESSFFALYSILSMFCRFCCCNHVYKYQPKKFGWCTLNNMIHSDCLVFCMRPRLYFRLLHLNTEKLSNIHYNFFSLIHTRFPFFPFVCFAFLLLLCFLVCCELTNDSALHTYIYRCSCDGEMVPILRMCHWSCPSERFNNVIHKRSPFSCLRFNI